ncbi:MAG: universal stress protein [Sedimenticolaceae bacterium]
MTGRKSIPIITRVQVDLMAIPRFKTILYATDLGKNMRPVFRHAISVAEQYQAKIIMLHVAQPLGATGKAALELYSPKKGKSLEHDAMKEILEKMQKRLEKFQRDELGEDSTLVGKVVAVVGEPAEKIWKFAASEDVDLIVVGSHTGGGFGSGFLGSTARKLINMSDRPVLVVPVKK